MRSTPWPFLRISPWHIHKMIISDSVSPFLSFPFFGPIFPLNHVADLLGIIFERWTLCEMTCSFFRKYEWKKKILARKQADWHRQQRPEQNWWICHSGESEGHWGVKSLSLCGNDARAWTPPRTKLQPSDLQLSSDTLCCALLKKGAHFTLFAGPAGAIIMPSPLDCFLQILPFKRTIFAVLRRVVRLTTSYFNNCTDTSAVRTNPPFMQKKGQIGGAGLNSDL